MEVTLKLLLLLVALCQSQSQSWDYANQEWETIGYPLCNGTRQSPIRINTPQTTLKSYPGITFSNYDIIENVRIENNGHTAEIMYMMDSTKPQISGGPLDMNARYQLVNVHFHWGATDALGAEHVINNQRYSMEVHVVHYNMKYGNVMEALNHPGGIAVIAMLLQANPRQGLAGLQSVVNALSEIVGYRNETEIQNFQLSALLPVLKQKTYYTYAGSLTTPACNEAVTWIIYPKPVLVKSAQLEPFRRLRDNRGNALVDNFRQLQDLNGRKIYEGRNKRRSPPLL